MLAPTDNEAWRLATDTARELEGVVGTEAVHEILQARFASAIATGEHRMRVDVLAELKGIAGMLDTRAPERRRRERE